MNGKKYKDKQKKEKSPDVKKERENKSEEFRKVLWGYRVSKLKTGSKVESSIY